LQENNDRGPVISDYLSLVKFRLSLAVAFSAATGYLVYNSHPGFDFILLFSGVLLLTSGSAALNQYTEREQDAMMKRTMYRPVASKRISAGSAVNISAVLIITGCLLLLSTGLNPFILGCCGIILYNLIYTCLKKVSPLALIPGAMVGSVPPLIGYASAGGMVLNDKILFFTAFMFIWQIPHFWLLLMSYGKEYQDAGFKTIYDHMNYRQIRILTLSWIVFWSLILVLFAYYAGVFISFFTIILFSLTAVFIALFLVFLFSGNGNKGLKYSFALLNLYSFFIMVILIADSLMK
jgi:protoheme IX farnesyltransferase